VLKDESALNGNRIAALLLSCFLVAVATNAQAAPPHQPAIAAGIDLRNQLTILPALLSQYSSSPCLNINGLVMVALADRKLTAQQSSVPAIAQTLKSGVTLPQYLRAALVAHCLSQEQKQFRQITFLWTIQKSQAINASANVQQNSITVTSGMIDFLRDDPAELAFVVAHELGHLADQPQGCAAALQREKIVTHGHSDAQRQFEVRADNLGFQYLIAAGFDPYASAAFFGRLQMYQGTPSARTPWVMTHPISEARIQSLRQLLLKLMQDKNRIP
jgi:Zn-dependent protease with chaperone function